LALKSFCGNFGNPFATWADRENYEKRSCRLKNFRKDRTDNESARMQAMVESPRTHTITNETRTSKHVLKLVRKMKHSFAHVSVINPVVSATGAGGVITCDVTFPKYKERVFSNWIPSLEQIACIEEVSERCGASTVSFIRRDPTDLTSGMVDRITRG
jgi:hypothetical protein